MILTYLDSIISDKGDSIEHLSDHVAQLLIEGQQSGLSSGFEGQSLSSIGGLSGVITSIAQVIRIY